MINDFEKALAALDELEDIDQMLRAGRELSAPVHAPSPDKEEENTKGDKKTKENEKKNRIEEIHQTLSNTLRKYLFLNPYVLAKDDLKRARRIEKEVTEAVLEFLPDSVWRIRPFSEGLLKYCGYSTKHRSLSICVLEKEKVKAIYIQKANKVIGSKKTIPKKMYETENPFIFVIDDPQGYVIAELMRLNYLFVPAYAENAELPAKMDSEKILLLACETGTKKKIEKLYTENIALPFPKLFDLAEAADEEAVTAAKEMPVNPKYVKFRLREEIEKNIQKIIGGEK